MVQVDPKSSQNETKRHNRIGHDVYWALYIIQNSPPHLQFNSMQASSSHS